MVEWYWQGKTEVVGEKLYTAWVVGEWMSMEQWWNGTDRGTLKNCAVVEWYWQGKTEEMWAVPVSAQRCASKFADGLDWPGIDTGTSWWETFWVIGWTVARPKYLSVVRSISFYLSNVTSCAFRLICTHHQADRAFRKNCLQLHRGFQSQTFIYIYIYVCMYIYMYVYTK